MSRQSAIQASSSNSIQVAPQQAPAQAPEQANAWSYVPAMDVIELNDEYVIHCDAPGLAVDQIDLSFEDGSLHLHASVAQRYAEGTRFLRQEYGVGDFDRLIPLGRLAEFVDGDRISAEYESGVLLIRLPKLATAQPKKISVKSA